MTLQFDGFVPPTKNYFPVPNNWIDICAHIRDISELKVIQYVIRHTWGFREYGICKTISVDEFMHGRRKQDQTRMDCGTGLSEQGVRNGLKKAIKDGYLICEVDPKDAGRIKKSYALRMQADTGQVQTLDPPQTLDLPTGTNFIPGGSKEYTPGVQDLDPRVPEFVPRTEKDTLERHLEKDTLERHLEKDTLERHEDITISASAESGIPIDFAQRKTESAKLKAVSLHVASSGYQKEKEEDTGEQERVIRPVLTIGGGGTQHDRNDLSGDWSSLPGAVHDKPRRDLSSPGDIRQTEPPGGGQTETAPAHPLDVVAQTPDAGTHSLAATPPGDGQDDGTRDQALLALPDAGQVASAPAASTALGVFSPTPTSGVQQGAAGHTPPKLKKTVIVKDTAGPPAFPSESDAWGTTTCLRLFDFWRGAPLCDLGQLKYASSCAKRLAETYSRVQVVLVRTAMNNQKFWKEQGGADVCDVARHMGKELNKLKMPVAPTQQQPDQSRPTLEEVECIDPTWCVYQRPGDTQEWILWQGELLTEDEANDRGYGGGGGLYIQTQYA